MEQSKLHLVTMILVVMRCAPFNNGGVRRRRGRKNVGTSLFLGTLRTKRFLWLGRAGVITLRKLDELCFQIPDLSFEGGDVGEELFYRKGSSTEKATDLAGIKAILGRFGQA